MVARAQPLNTALGLMTKFLAFVGLALTTFGAVACPNDLAGTWKSDRAASMDHARTNAKLQPKTEAFLEALWGNMTLSFDGSELHVVMPSIEVPVSGVTKPFAGSEERKPYAIVFCNRTSTVYTAKQPFGEELVATTFNFVDRDTFWVYGGDTDPAVPDVHIREYFRRVR